MIFWDRHYDFQGLCYWIKFENRALKYNYSHFGVNDLVSLMGCRIALFWVRTENRKP